MKSTLRGAYEALEFARAQGKNDRRWRPPSGDAIKSLRERLGLNQVEFSAEFGLDVAALQNWEQGRRVPEQAATILLSMIDREPRTVSRLISKIRRRQLDPV